jgi:hypothetical protein
LLPVPARNWFKSQFCPFTHWVEAKFSIMNTCAKSVCKIGNIYLRVES